MTSFFVLHALSSVSNVKKQGAITSFFKRVAIAVVFRLYPRLVCFLFPCTRLKEVQILAKCRITFEGYEYWGEYRFLGGRFLGVCFSSSITRIQ